MKSLTRILALVLVAGLAFGAAHPADAQIWKRAKERLKKKTEEAAEKAADKAVDEAVDNASQRLEGKIEEAFEKQAQDAANGDNAPGGMAGLQQSLNKLGLTYADSSIQPVDFRELKALLPGSLAGQPQQSISGESGGALGMRVSTAEATYGEGNGQVHAVLTDLGTLSNAAMLGYSWLLAEVDVESDTGYERTFDYNGHKAYETYNHDGDYEQGAVQLVISPRFIVALDGHTDAARLRTALGEIDISSLEDKAGDIPPEQLQQQQKVQSALDSLGQAFANMNQAMGTSTNGDVEPVDFRQLKALLPPSVAGRSRASIKGQRGNAFGIKVSSADAVYGDDGQGQIQLGIVDLGTLSGATLFGYGWLQADIDHEDDNGHERTRTYNGNPAYEKVERHGNTVRSTMQMVVNDRFVIAAEGDVDLSEVQRALDSVSTSGLPGM